MTNEITDGHCISAIAHPRDTRWLQNDDDDGDDDSTMHLKRIMPLWHPKSFCRRNRLTLNAANTNELLVSKR